MPSRSTKSTVLSGRGVKLTNAAGKIDADGPGGTYYIRDGIICVPRGAVIPDGTVV